MVVSDMAVARSKGDGAKKPINPFGILKPPPGVVPESAKMAMDDAYGAIATWAGGYGSPVGFGGVDGITFIGFPMLAEMAQRPEYRRITETIAGEMTRRWIRVTGTGEDDKSDRIAKINAALNRFKVREVFRKAAEHDGFFGRGHIYPDFGVSSSDTEQQSSIGDGQDDTSKAKIARGSLKGFKTIEPVWCYPSGYNSTDPLASNWYKPEFWFVQGNKLHASRLLTFVGREVPDLLKPAYSFGGLSMSQMVRPYIDNWLRTRQSVADLISSFSVSGLKLDLVSSLGVDGAGTALENRVALFTNYRDNRNTMILDKGAGGESPAEEFFNISTPLGTLDSLQAQAQEQPAAIAGIPLVKYLGVTPAGLNASSEGELQSFYTWIHAFQELLFRTPLQSVIGFIQLSEFGDVDPDIGFHFEPLWSLDEKALADVRMAEAQTGAVLIEAGVILPEEERQRIANDPDTAYPGLDLSLELNPPQVGEQDDIPDVPKLSAADEMSFSEEDHPRDNDGKFSTSGGGGTATGNGSEHYQATLTPATRRAFEGKSVETKTKLSKLETGATGEKVAIAHLKSLGIHDAGPLNSHITNYPIDLSGDHVAVEVKTGLVSNGSSAQQWRATIGQPGKEESAWLKTASAREKAAHNDSKKQAIMDRKLAALAALEQEKGARVQPKTLTTILNPDTKTVDVFMFDGFHHRIPWNGPEAKKAYVGSYSYD